MESIKEYLEIDSHELTKDQRKIMIGALGLSYDVVFVPFSRSRNKDERKGKKGLDGLSLNWKLTLKKDGKPFNVIDFSAGIAGCPSYKFNEKLTVHYLGQIVFECENGNKNLWDKKTVLPEVLSVFHCLASDSDVLDAGGFESWASNLGYDVDSRKAESIYKECLEQALKLRSVLGDDGMKALQHAMHGY